MTAVAMGHPIQLPAEALPISQAHLGASKAVMHSVFDRWEDLGLPLAYRSSFYLENGEKEAAYREEHARILALPNVVEFSNLKITQTKKQMKDAFDALAAERKGLANTFRKNYSEGRRLEIFEMWQIHERCKDRKMQIMNKLWSKDTLASPDGAQRSSMFVREISLSVPSGSLTDSMADAALKIAVIAQNKAAEVAKKLAEGKTLLMSSMQRRNTMPEVPSHEGPTHRWNPSTGGGYPDQLRTAPVIPTPIPSMSRTGSMKYPFVAGGKDEISVSMNERLAVIDTRGVDWLQVETCSGLRGLVPLAYVTIDTPPEVSHVGRADSTGPASSSPVALDLTKATIFEPEPEPSPSPEPEPSPSPEPSHYLLQAPYVSEVTEAPPPEPEPEPISAPVPGMPGWSYGKAIHEFVAAHDDEMSVQVGEEVTFCHIGDGWCTTKRMDGTEGIVPAAYMQLCPQ